MKVIKISKYYSKKTALCAKCGAEQCGCLVSKVVFDSIKEGRYYQDLLLLKKAGQVKDIELQPEFILQEGFNKNGKRYQAIKYRADFYVIYSTGEKEVIDVKGSKATRTEAYKIKKKLLLYKYPDINFNEII